MGLFRFKAPHLVLLEQAAELVPVLDRVPEVPGRPSPLRALRPALAAAEKAGWEASTAATRAKRRQEGTVLTRRSWRSDVQAWWRRLDTWVALCPPGPATDRLREQGRGDRRRYTFARDRLILLTRLLREDNPGLGVLEWNPAWIDEAEALTARARALDAASDLIDAERKEASAALDRSRKTLSVLLRRVRDAAVLDPAGFPIRFEHLDAWHAAATSASRGGADAADENDPAVDRDEAAVDREGESVNGNGAAVDGNGHAVDRSGAAVHRDEPAVRRNGLPASAGNPIPMGVARISIDVGPIPTDGSTIPTDGGGVPIDVGGIPTGGACIPIDGGVTTTRAEEAE